MTYLSRNKCGHSEELSVLEQGILVKSSAQFGEPLVKSFPLVPSTQNERVGVIAGPHGGPRPEPADRDGDVDGEPGEPGDADKLPGARIDKLFLPVSIPCTEMPHTERTED